MITPVSINMQVPMVIGLLPEPELLDNPSTCCVLRTNIYLDPVKSSDAERVIHGKSKGCGDDTATGDARVNPIPGVRGAERPACDVADDELTHQLFDAAVQRAHSEWHGLSPPSETPQVREDQPERRWRVAR